MFIISANAETRHFNEAKIDKGQMWTSFLIAFIVGTVAGILRINLMGQEITKEFILALIGIGYAGTDFIEGLIVKKVYMIYHLLR